MTFSAPIKDPDSVLNYSLDWSEWLDGAAIDDHEVTASDGITIDSSSVEGAAVLWWLSGGEAGRTYRITVEVSASDGRVDQRSVIVRVRDR